MKRLTVAIALCACGGATLDVDALGDYTAWKRIDTRGPTPGHGDTYRIIYVNDVAREPGGQRSVGAILVKEVYDNVNDQPGPLQAIEVMRRVGPVSASANDQGGWLFSGATTPGGAETEKTTCWRRCHVQAPFAGAWMDYSR